GFRTKTASQLAWDTGRLNNGADAFSVSWPAQLGSVQVNDVQIGCSEIYPMPGKVGRVAAEDRLLGVISLEQADALAPAQINRRNDEHGPSPQRESPFWKEAKEKVYRKALNLGRISQRPMRRVRKW